MISVAAISLAVGAATLYAANEPSLYIPRSEASPGDKVSFSISNTELGARYSIFVGSEKVAGGTDEEGDGVTDSFVMPDLGSSRKVNVEARISHEGSVWTGYRPIEFVAATSASGGGNPSPVQQPAAAPLATPAPQSSPRARTRTRETPATNRRTRSRRDSSPGRTRSRSRSPARSNPSPTTDVAPSPPARTRTTTPDRSSSRSRAPRLDSSSGAGAPSATPPAGASPPPTSGSEAPAAGGRTVSGATQVGGGGFPFGAVLAIALIALVALAIPGRRLIRERMMGPAADLDLDALRIDALSRAARSSREVQERIAEHKASRTKRLASSLRGR